MNSYTRNDLAVDYSSKTGVSVDNAKDTIEHILTFVSSALTARRKVEFRGFGVMEVVRRKEKIGRNPKAPENGTYQIPAKNVVKFRIGKVLDAAINNEAA